MEDPGFNRNCLVTTSTAPVCSSHTSPVGPVLPCLIVNCGGMPGWGGSVEAKTRWSSASQAVHSGKGLHLLGGQGIYLVVVIFPGLTFYVPTRLMPCVFADVMPSPEMAFTCPLHVPILIQPEHNLNDALRKTLLNICHHHCRVLAPEQAFHWLSFCSILMTVSPVGHISFLSLYQNYLYLCFSDICADWPTFSLVYNSVKDHRRKIPYREVTYQQIKYLRLQHMFMSFSFIQSKGACFLKYFRYISTQPQNIHKILKIG